MSVLSPEQRDTFTSQGYLLASGLIADDTVRAARTELERLLLEQPDRPNFGTDAAAACYNERVCAAAAELGGDAETRPYYPVRSAFALITRSSPGAEWNWPSPHIDHAIEKDGYHVFPRPYRLASMLFLNDVARHGGGTIVWPGSHRVIEALAKSDPTRYELMAVLNRDFKEAGIGDPVELTPRAGDILFYHYLLAHAGSRNMTDQPRFGLNHKW
jgi:hypothetical protein